MADFKYQKPFPILKDDTEYRCITKEYVSTIEVDGRKILKVAPEGLEMLAKEAFSDEKIHCLEDHKSSCRKANYGFPDLSFLQLFKK